MKKYKIKYRVNRPFFYVNLGATTDPRLSLIGSTHFSNEKGTFTSESYFVQAIKTPNAIVLLDELTRAHPDAWNILMSVLDEHQRYLRIDEHWDTPTVKVADGVSFIATANIGSEYTATRVLDRAIVDRFTCVVEMEPLDRADEVKFLKTLFPDVPDKDLIAICTIAETTRIQVKAATPKVNVALSTRSTIEMAGLLNDGFTFEEAAEVSIVPLFTDVGGRESERTFMRQQIQMFLEGGQAKKSLLNNRVTNPPPVGSTADPTLPDPTPLANNNQNNAQPDTRPLF